MKNRLLNIFIFYICLPIFSYAAPQLEEEIFIQALYPPEKSLGLNNTQNIAIVCNIYNDTRSDSLKK